MNSAVLRNVPDYVPVNTALRSTRREFLANHHETLRIFLLQFVKFNATNSIVVGADSLNTIIISRGYSTAHGFMMKHLD
jgi:hypothetical protein